MIKIKSQTDYLVTEVTMEAPCDLGELETLMKKTHGTGKIVGLYCGGGVSGVNLEQRTRVPERVAQKVRDLVGVDTETVDGN
jgi:hypothetical protein